jgi:hypothetical protein
MSASIFETIPEKTLFKFIKMVMEEVDFETLESSQDSELREGIETVESTLGIRGNDSSLDCDYIYNVWRMNEDLFEEGRLIGNLDKPTLKKVEFDWNAWETQWVKLTYRHQIETYGTDKSNIYNYIYGMSSEGDMSYWDGNLINTDNYDSETTDESIDDNFTIL